MADTNLEFRPSVFDMLMFVPASRLAILEPRHDRLCLQRLRNVQIFSLGSLILIAIHPYYCHNQTIFHLIDDQMRYILHAIV